METTVAIDAFVRQLVQGRVERFASDEVHGEAPSLKRGVGFV